MKVVLELPEKPELKNLDVTGYLIAKLYQDGLLSAGQAAQVLGITHTQNSWRAWLDLGYLYSVNL